MNIILLPLHTRRPILFFFFNDTATTEIYTLSLHDALPIFAGQEAVIQRDVQDRVDTLQGAGHGAVDGDRKSTRLNSSHLVISYAVFCLKKKKRRSSTRRPQFRSTPPYIRLLLRCNS